MRLSNSTLKLNLADGLPPNVNSKHRDSCHGYGLTVTATGCRYTSAMVAVAPIKLYTSVVAPWANIAAADSVLKHLQCGSAPNAAHVQEKYEKGLVMLASRTCGLLQ